MPSVTYFKPAGIPLRVLKENRLSLEEMEAIRLRDLEHMEQEPCASKMNISRPTFQRILASARKKIADSLLSGKALRIEGGIYELSGSRFRCNAGHECNLPGGVSQNPDCCPICDKSTIFPVLAEKESDTQMASTVGQETNTQSGQKIHGGIRTMKIAIASENGTTISQHFGKATQYVVVNTEEGKIISKETRPKIGHGDFQGKGQMSHECGCGVHGYGAGSREKHGAMAQNIRDCTVLLAGGMGWGAYESLKSYNVEPVVTDVKDIEQAVKLFLEGKLPNLMERLH